MMGYGQHVGWGGQQAWGQQAASQWNAASGWGAQPAHGGYGAQQYGHQQSRPPQIQQAPAPQSRPPQIHQQPAPVGLQGPKPAAATAPAQAGGSGGETITVTGCTHATVGGIVRGTYQLSTENHGKKAYKKDQQVNGLDVMIYFWDDRDGPGFCGWWFGPKIGGDQVWAYHTDRSATSPPSSGWKVPYDGPVDPSMNLATKPKAGTAPQPQWGHQAMPAAQQFQANILNKQREEQKRLEEQRKQLEDMKRQQGRGGAVDDRRTAMETQQQRLQENRRKLEEAAKKRLEDQKQKMEDLKRQKDEDAKKRQDEMEAKRQEQTSALKIRRIIQKVRQAQSSTWEAVEKELADVLESDLDKCGPQKAKIQEECETVKKQSKNRIDMIEKKRKEEEDKKNEMMSSSKLRNLMLKYKRAQTGDEAIRKELDEAMKEDLDKCKVSKEKIQQEYDQLVAQKKEDEEKRLAELTTRKEAKAKAEELIKKLTDLVEAAEAAAKGVAEEAEPFNVKDDMTLKGIESRASAVEEANEDFLEKAKTCLDFATSNAVAMRNTPHIQGEPPSTCAQDLGKLQNKVNLLKASTLKVIGTVEMEKQARIKKAEAKAVFEKEQSIFKKYDSDKDGHLSRKEILAYAKGQFAYTIPSDTMDLIIKVLVPDGSKGVKKDDLHRLKVMIGFSREQAMDDKRRSDREAHEKLVADKRVEIQELLEKVSEKVVASQDEVLSLEKVINALPGRVRPMKAAEMMTAAEEVESTVNAATSSVGSCKEMVAELNVDVVSELKSFLTSEIKKLEGQVRGLDTRLSKARGTVNKFKAEANKKSGIELEGLRESVLQMIRHHQAAKNLRIEDIFKEMDKNKDGKIDEKEFSGFLKTCEKKPKDKKEGTKVNGAEEEVDDDTMSDEDLARVFAYLDSEENGSIVKESFLNIIRHYMKVVKAVILTDKCSITGGKNLRRLEPDEVVEVIEGPVKEDTVDVQRLHVKVISDGLDGWLTPIGNQGTVFLKDGGNQMKVLKETILTGSFQLDTSKDDNRKLNPASTRKLKVGEIVEVREWAKKDESGLMRCQVKVKSDGHIGWATSVGNTGIVFLAVI